MPRTEITNRDILIAVEDLKAELRTETSELKNANAEMVYSICRTIIWLLVLLSILITGTVLILDALNILA